MNIPIPPTRQQVTVAFEDTVQARRVWHVTRRALDRFKQRREYEAPSPRTVGSAITFATPGARPEVGDAQVPRVLELALQYLIIERKSKVKKS
jgi:hypothetical protein